MIEKMQKVYICGFADQTVDILEEMMKCGIVETTKAETMIDKEVFESVEAKEHISLSKEEELIDKLNTCIVDLKPFAKKKGMFAHREEITYDELTDDDVLLETIKIYDKVENINAELIKDSSQKRELSFEKAQLEPWTELDAAPKDLKTDTCSAMYYVLPEKSQLEDVEAEMLAEKVPAVLRKVSEERGYKYFISIHRKSDEAKIKEVIARFAAKECDLSHIENSIAEEITVINEKILSVEKNIEELNQNKIKIAVELPKLQQAYDAVNVRLNCLKGQEDLFSTEKTNIITGWIPEKEIETLNKNLEKYNCYCKFEAPKKNEEFPVLLKNNKVVAPFSAITEMYSSPDSRSMDSNWAIAFFFFLFFGMMLSDAGYGLVLFVGGFIGAKKLDLAEGSKRMFKMLGYCGISTMIWGFLYGSFFGDSITKVADTFFGADVQLPMLIDPLNNPMLVLGMSCAFGVIHLFVGMGLKAYLMIRRGHLWGAIFDVGLWYMVLIGLPLLLVPGIGGTIGKVLSIVGAIGLVLTQGREKPTIVGKITSGVMSLYDITGYFSDVLSYSRILALGLATGVVASVVNIMGTMSGGGIIGMIAFLVIFIAGHVLNLGINALGAYVHSARLQYVEFFGKYYESGGKKFEPLRIKTKYTKVAKEN